MKIANYGSIEKEVRINTYIDSYFTIGGENMSIQSKRLKVFVNKQKEGYASLTISNKGLQLNDKKIPIESIEYINISLCCSKVEDGRYYGILNLYFIYLDIVTKNSNYSFQLMNNDEVNELFIYLISQNVEINDPLQLIRLYSDLKDSEKLYNYLNKHFKVWRKEYNLELIPFEYSFIENNYIKPLQNLNKEDVPSFKEQMKLLINGYKGIFQKKDDD